MGRKKATGRFETRDELVTAVWANSRFMNDSQNARATGVSTTTIASIIRESPKPNVISHVEGIIPPHHAEQKIIINSEGDEIAAAKTDTIAIVIANALNEVSE